MSEDIKQDPTTNTTASEQDPQVTDKGRVLSPREFQSYAMDLREKLNDLMHDFVDDGEEKNIHPAFVVGAIQVALQYHMGHAAELAISHLFSEVVERYGIEFPQVSLASLEQELEDLARSLGVDPDLFKDVGDGIDPVEAA